MMQLQASAAPPDLARDLVIQDMRSGMKRQEAKIESQKKPRSKVVKEVLNQRRTF